MTITRPIAAIVVALALLLAGQARLCVRAQGCVMHGAKSSAARTCSPAMGRDCCEPRSAPATTPQPSEDRRAKLVSTLAPLASAPVRPAPPTFPGVQPDPASRAAHAPAVPLYTLLATLLI